MRGSAAQKQSVSAKSAPCSAWSRLQSCAQVRHRSPWAHPSNRQCPWPLWRVSTASCRMRSVLLQVAFRCVCVCLHEPAKMQHPGCLRHACCGRGAAQARARRPCTSRQRPRWPGPPRPAGPRREPPRSWAPGRPIDQRRRSRMEGGPAPPPRRPRVAGPPRRRPALGGSQIRRPRARPRRRRCPGSAPRRPPPQTVCSSQAVKRHPACCHAMQLVSLHWYCHPPVGHCYCYVYVLIGCRVLSTAKPCFLAPRTYLWHLRGTVREKIAAVG